MPRVFVCPALATGDCLSALRWSENMADAEQPVAVFGLPSPNPGDGWHHFSRHPPTFARLVSHDLATDGSEVGSQRAGVTAYFGVRQLSNCLDDAPQTPPGNGAPRTRSACRAR